MMISLEEAWRSLICFPHLRWFMPFWRGTDGGLKPMKWTFCRRNQLLTPPKRELASSSNRLSGTWILRQFEHNCSLWKSAGITPGRFMFISSSQPLGSLTLRHLDPSLVADSKLWLYLYLSGFVCVRLSYQIWLIIAKFGATLAESDRMHNSNLWRLFFQVSPTWTELDCQQQKA